MNTEILHWSYRDFHAFPDELRNYVDFVREIYLKENFIPSLPVWLFDLTNLRFIQLAGNVIEELPAEIGMLVNLEELNLARNCLSRLPNTIGALRHLRELDVSDNRLEQIPPEICHLNILRRLDASNNNLVALPTELSHLGELFELDVSGNARLTEIPACLLALPKLEFFSANYCALTCLPSRIEAPLRRANVFDNCFLTHYPLCFEIYIQPWMEFKRQTFLSQLPTHATDHIKLYSSNCNRVFVLSNEITAIRSGGQTRLPNSLMELCLVSSFAIFHKLHSTGAVKLCLPHAIERCFANGPMARCCCCSKAIFKECYLILLRRIQNLHEMVFSAMFCSMDCKDLWLKQNQSELTLVSWTELKQ